jgi:hypothetical protein
MDRGGTAGVVLSFHLGGKSLASYTGDDLGKLGIEITKRRGPGPSTDFRPVGCEQVPGTNDCVFVIESRGKRVAFDVLTGKPTVRRGG